MLRIRTSQYDTLRQRALDSYKAGLQDHLARHFPMPMEHARPEGRAALVDLAVERAATHGLTTVATVQVFADHMVYLGAFWDEDPMIEEIAALLDDQGLTSIQRMDEVHAAARTWMRRTRGEPATVPLLFESAARAQSWLNWQKADTELSALLPRIAPEKAKAGAPGALNRFITAAEARAESHGLAPGPGRDAAVVAAWIGGVGLLDDPLYHRGELAAASNEVAREQMMIEMLRETLNGMLAAGYAAGRA